MPCYRDAIRRFRSLRECIVASAQLQAGSFKPKRLRMDGAGVATDVVHPIATLIQTAYIHCELDQTKLFRALTTKEKEINYEGDSW